MDGLIAYILAKKASGGLPPVSSTDNGKSLVVENGEWSVDDILPAPGTSGNVLTSNGTGWVSAAPATELPAYSGADNGKVLMVVNGAVAWATLPPAEGEDF